MDTIINWNCRGFKRNLDEVKNMLRDHDPLAFCFQETFIGPGKVINFRKYSSYHYHSLSTDGRSVGGVTIMIKKSVPHKQIMLNSNIQAVAVTISASKTITLCSIYLPPSFKVNLKDMADLVDQLPKPYLLVGDFNAHNVIWDGNSNVTENTKGKIIEKFIADHDLCIYNDGSPTYIHPASGSMTAIDLSLCSPSLFLNFDWTVHEDLCGSDHFPTFLKFNGVGNNDGVQRWRFKGADWPEFKNICSRELTPDLFRNVNDNKVEIFASSLHFVAEITIPKTAKVPKKLNKPWWNDACEQAVRDRIRALRIFKSNPTQENLDNFKLKYALARREIRESMRDSWKNYVSGLNSRTPIKKTWDMVRKILGKRQTPKINHLEKNGSFVTNKTDIANTIGESIAKNSSSDNYTKEFQRLKRMKENIRINFNSNNQESYNKTISLRELKEALKCAKDTAVGPDEIHYQIIKHLPSVSMETLLDVFNDVWLNARFPESWHQATIIPIAKPGKDPTNPNNYRPIALTSCLCKLFERIINKRLVFYLENNGIITECQSGFRKSKSTIDHIIRLESAVRQAFIKKEHLVTVYFDLEKAYDTTWKKGIMMDLHEAGLRGRLPLFISEFLEKRKFSVRIGSTLSDLYDQEEGVPQGSILSVTLFSMKINSIVGVISRGIDCSLYVDDFLICYNSKSMATIERQMQQCLKKIENWALENGFRFSSTKTVCMHFCQLRKFHHDPELKIYGNQIPLVKEYKFLGVVFDSKLSFIPHIKYIKNKGLKALNLLKTVSRMDWGADQEVLLRLYRSHIRSKLDYACIVYGSARPSYIKSLDTIHNQGIRICLGAFRTSPVESLYVASNEESLYRRRERLSVQYALKIKSTPVNPVYSCVFDPKYRDLFLNRPKTIPTFGIRVAGLMRDIDTSVISVSKYYDREHWTLKCPSPCYSLKGGKKSQTHPLEYMEKFNKVRHKYQNYDFIYTDGSKENERVGSAAVFANQVFLERLPNHASIFSGELHALKLALSLIDRSRYDHFVICSDSLSALQAIENMKLENPLVVEFLLQYNALIDDHKDIILCWVPSHIGIEGNDKADRGAKQALELDIQNIKIPYTDLYGVVKCKFKQQWQEFWDQQIENKLHAIQPTLGARSFSRRLRRRDELLINRVRIGHTYMSHKYLLHGEEKPFCIPCNEILTVKHILIDCVEFMHIRDRYFNVKTMKELINDVGIDILLRFISEAGLRYSL